MSVTNKAVAPSQRCIDAPDALALTGCALVVIGVGLWSVPVALIVAGLFSFASGVLLGRIRSSTTPKAE